MDNFQNNTSLLPILSELEQIIGPSTYELWFKEQTQFSFQNNQLIITIPNATWAEEIQQRFQKTIKDLFFKHFNTDILITYNIVPVQTKPVIPELEIVPKTNISPFDPDHTFDKFIESSSNRFAYKTAQAVVKNLGAKQNNPFVIYSAPGLGKTHLLHAIGNEILKNNPSAKVAYMTGEDFVKEFVEYLFQKTKDDAFRKKYASLDCLLLDDIQFVAGKKDSTKEFFYTFNTLYTTGKQIVLSSDRSPQQLDWDKDTDDRMLSRIKSGIQTEIKRPEVETRIAILRQKRDDLNFIIGDDVLTFIAQGIQTNVRELEAALYTVKLFCDTNEISPSIEIAKEILKDRLVLEDSKPIEINVIKKIVAKRYNVKIEDLSSSRRMQSIVWPRQIAMYLATNLTDLSLLEIGREFNRDHSTIIHARDIVQDKIDTDPFFSADINALISDIKAVDNK